MPLSPSISYFPIFGKDSDDEASRRKVPRSTSYRTVFAFSFLSKKGGGEEGLVRTIF
jgi:hypothetical protein